MVGDWISIRAQAERHPVRFNVRMTLGELPEGWVRSGRHARTWAGVAGVVLIAPFVALIAAGLLRGVGLTQAYDWVSTSNVAIIAATVSLFIGIPVAIAMNIWRITHIGWRRHADAVEGLVAVEVAPLHLGVVAVALIVGVAFVAHVAADSYACWNGVRSAC